MDVVDYSYASELLKATLLNLARKIAFEKPLAFHTFLMSTMAFNAGQLELAGDFEFESDGEEAPRTLPAFRGRSIIGLPHEEAEAESFEKENIKIDGRVSKPKHRKADWGKTTKKDISQMGLEVTRGQLEGLFNMKLRDAAKHIGVGRTLFKKICRRQGIVHWPHSQNPNGILSRNAVDPANKSESKKPRQNPKTLQVTKAPDKASEAPQKPAVSRKLIESKSPPVPRIRKRKPKAAHHRGRNGSGKKLPVPAVHPLNPLSQLPVLITYVPDAPIAINPDGSSTVDLSAIERCGALTPVHTDGADGAYEDNGGWDAELEYPSPGEWSALSTAEQAMFIALLGMHPGDKSRY